MIPGSGYERVDSSALVNPQATKIGQIFAAGAAEHPGKSGFRLLPVGLDGFAMRMQMIERAERSIDMQYYIIQVDDTGRLLTDALLSAADRGVRVRILLDDATTTEREATIHALGAHPQIEVRLFNPYFYRGYSSIVRGMEFVTNSTRLD